MRATSRPGKVTALALPFRSRAVDDAGRNDKRVIGVDHVNRILRLIATFIVDVAWRAPNSHFRLSQQAFAAAIPPEMLLVTFGNFGRLKFDEYNLTLCRFAEENSEEQEQKGSHEGTVLLGRDVGSV